MEKIDSFKIDHLKLTKGLYVSRRDKTPSGDTLTTFDIRLTDPNKEDAVSAQALHSIEHLAATWLRNNSKWAERVIYWGPMGCCTGCYLILAGELYPSDIEELMKDMFLWIFNYEGTIPGATPKDCGNYLFNDLKEAKRIAKRYYNEVLLNLNDLNTKYPS